MILQNEYKIVAKCAHVGKAARQYCQKNTNMRVKMAIILSNAFSKLIPGNIVNGEIKKGQKADLTTLPLSDTIPNHFFKCPLVFNSF